MNEDEKLQVQLNKFKKLMNEWTLLQKAYFNELFACTISSDTFAFDPSLFVTRASRHIDAAIHALNRGNTHSLAIQARTLYELVNRYYPSGLFILANETDVQSHLGKIVSKDLQKTIEAAMRLNPEEAIRISETKEKFSKSFNAFLAERQENGRPYRSPTRKYKTQYSPNLEGVDQFFDDFLEGNNKPHVQKRTKGQTRKKSNDYQKWYKLLSEIFFHPNPDTLQKSIVFGGTKQHSKNDEALYYNLFLFNNVLVWTIWLTNRIIEIFTHFLKAIPKREHCNKLNPKLISLDPQLEHLINGLTGLIAEYQQLYERHSAHLSNDMEEDAARLHKFYIHSSSANLYSKNLNLEASCVELSVMNEMLKMSSHSSKEQNIDGHYFNIYKHPMLFHFGFNVNEGGNHFSSINQLATVVTIRCIWAHFVMWQHAIAILLEACDEEKNKSLVYKSCEIAQSSKQYQDITSKMLRKHAKTFD